MDMNTHSKLIMAVVQEDDYDATVSQLNKNGFFVTMLSSTGGFWKKKNITIMLGVPADQLDKAGKCLEQVSALLSDQDVALEELSRAYDSTAPDKVPAPVPLEEEP